LQALAALFIENGEHQVKTSQHFHQPLVYQAVGHHNQYPPGTATDQLLVNNETGFNGFAKTDPIRQQHPRRMAAGHLAGNIELVGQELSSGSQQPQSPRLLQATLMLYGFAAKLKAGSGIDLPGKEAILGFAEVDKAVEVEFIHMAFLALAVLATVNKSPPLVVDSGDYQAAPFIAANIIPLRVLDAIERGIVEGVNAVLADGGKTDFHAAVNA